MPSKKATATSRKSAARKFAASTNTPGNGRTVIYCHGIGNKPPENKLRSDWYRGEMEVDGYASTISLDLSIGDPANLEDAIAVGSVHPTLPHRYGTSYFSSRGPTADGRLKPDLVARGERILSCRSGTGRRTTEKSLYVEQSGTSMAAPHVSGLLAAFLSVRREFIGHPERVKSILLENCTDLKRDRNHQGAGLPNLAKMLLHT